MMSKEGRDIVCQQLINLVGIWGKKKQFNLTWTSSKSFSPGVLFGTYWSYECRPPMSFGPIEADYL